MSETVVRVEHLSKRYRLGEAGSGYKTLRESISRWVTGPFTRRARGSGGAPSDRSAIWALRDVSLSICSGEVIGVIGRNGAGKTTLLKILSRITDPTEGKVILRGRVGSLLEVGTGFHPELTGRENIYLNGAILGMRRGEIERKFDQIVEFAEVSRFLDTPVKRYSSGMYTRLAFSVAAHMEPEILLVDEVLAVGDLAFQRRCIGKMSEVAGAGRTVVFVSHNMQAVGNLCPRTVLLERGAIEADGETHEVILHYNELLKSQRVGESTALHDTRHRRGSGSARFSEIEVVDRQGESRFVFEMGESVCFRLAYAVRTDVAELYVSVALRSALSGEIVTSVRHPLSTAPISAGRTGVATIEIPEIPIRPGQYPLYFWLGDLKAQPFDVVDDLTAPLTIKVGSSTRPNDFHRDSPVGLVSVGSRIVRE